VRPVDAGADQVGRQQVRRELDALELAADRRGERLDRQRLRQPRHALDEQMAAGEQPDRHPLEQQVLTDDRALDLEQHLLEGIRRRWGYRGRHRRRRRGRRSGRSVIGGDHARAE
jgi:hypothetical protein